MTTAADILAAAPYCEAEEATYNVASLCRDAGELRGLLEALGLPPVKRRWTVPRAGRRVLSAGRDGFSDSVMRHFLPRRAHHLIPDTIAGLAAAGFAEPDPCGLDRYRLTPAGRVLAVDLRGDRDLAIDVPYHHFTQRD